MGYKSEVSHLQGAQTKALWQPRVMWAVGGKLQREGTCVYLCLIHVDVGQKPTLHCKASESEVKSLSRVLTLCDPWTVGYQAPPSMGFSGQVYWSGLPFPSPGVL